MANPYQQIGRNILQPSPLSALPVEAEADPGQKIERLKSLLTEENWFTPFGEKIRSLINSFSGYHRQMYQLPGDFRAAEARTGQQSQQALQQILARQEEADSMAQAQAGGGLPPAPLPGSATAPFPGDFFAGEALARQQSQQALQQILARQERSDQEQEQAVKAQQTAENRFLSLQDKTRAVQKDREARFTGRTDIVARNQAAQAQALGVIPFVGSLDQPMPQADPMDPNQLPPEVAKLIAMNQATQAQQQQAPVPSPILPEPQGPPPIFPEPNAPTQELMNEIAQLASNQILPEPGGVGPGPEQFARQEILPPADGQKERIEEKIQAALDAIKAKREQGEAELARAQAATAEPEPEPEVVATAEPATATVIEPEAEVATAEPETSVLEPAVINEDGTVVPQAVSYEDITTTGTLKDVTTIEKYTEIPKTSVNTHVGGAQLQPAAVTIVPTDPKAPNADPKIAAPVSTGNQMVKVLDKKIKGLMQRLSRTKDPDSVQPFWNWLSDFSAGMRAAAQTGDQTLGAVAAGFDNVRKGTQARAATELATEKITIENLKNLGDLREDILASERAGMVGAAAQSLFKGYGEPGQVFGANGRIPQPYVEEVMGGSPRHSGTYSTNKNGKVDLKLWEPGEVKTVRFYRKDNRGLTGPNYVDVSTDSVELDKMYQDPNYTDVAPNEKVELMSDADLTEFFGPEAIERFGATGSAVHVTKNPDGSVKKVEVNTPPKSSLANFMDPETRIPVTLDTNNPADMRLARDKGLVRYDVQIPKVTASASVKIQNKIDSGRQGIALIRRLQKLRKDQGGTQQLLGVVAKMKGGIQNIHDILDAVAGEVIEFTSFAHQFKRDIDTKQVEPDVVDWFNKDLSAAKFLTNSLVYKYARTVKGAGRINSKDIEKGEEALGFDKVITSERAIFAALEEAIPMFQRSIDDQTNLLVQLKKRKIKPGKVGDDTPAEKNVARRKKHIGILKNNPTLEVQGFFDKWYGPGAAKKVLGIQ